MNPPSRTALCGLLVLSFSSCVISFAQSLPVSLITNDDSNEHPLYLKVRLSDGIKISKLRPSDATEGVFSRSVYSGERELFPAGSHVRLIVSRLERRRRAETAQTGAHEIKDFEPSTTSSTGQQAMQELLRPNTNARVVLPGAKTNYLKAYQDFEKLGTEEQNARETLNKPCL